MNISKNLPFKWKFFVSIWKNQSHSKFTWITKQFLILNKKTNFLHSFERTNFPPKEKSFLPQKISKFFMLVWKKINFQKKKKTSPITTATKNIFYACMKKLKHLTSFHLLFSIHLYYFYVNKTCKLIRVLVCAVIYIYEIFVESICFQMNYKLPKAYISNKHLKCKPNTGFHRSFLRN